jgi:hypothetical protein
MWAGRGGVVNRSVNINAMLLTLAICGLIYLICFGSPRL